MSTVKLTKSVVEALPANTFAWDSVAPGYGVRRQTIAPFYLLRYRIGGRQRYVRIGKHGAPWTVETARKEALRLLGQIAGGVDPQAAKESAALTQSETFGATIERYLSRAQRKLKPKTFSETARYLRSYAKPLHAMPLTEITRRHIATLLGQVEESGAATRNRCRTNLRAFFKWSIAEGLLETNPVIGTEPAEENNSRDRILSDDEIATLWRGLGDGRFPDIVRLLLLTGARRTEIGNLQWDEIDLDAGTISLAPGRTKNGRAHSVPLSPQALAIVQRQPRRNSTPFLFSDGKGFKDWDKAKKNLDARTNIAPWTIHDLRRSAASGLQRLGIRGEVIERALNHISGSFRGVAGIYQRDPLADEVRDALKRWGAHVAEITQEGKEG